MLRSINMNSKTENTWLRLWGPPILVGFISLLGLVCALTGDGIWDILSWISLGIPVVLIGYYWKKK